MSALREQSSDTTLTRQEICKVDNDMNTQSSGVKLFEKVFSDIRSAAKEMIPRIQEPTDMRSLEEKTAIFESSLRQAEKMFKDQDSHYRRLWERSCFLEAALNASQEKTIQMKRGLHEEKMKECEIFKSQIITDHCRELLPIVKSLEDMRKICVKNEETFLKERTLLQQSLEDMRNICVRNEETFVKEMDDLRNICVRNELAFVEEMDDLQQEIARREEDIKKLNLQLLKSCSKEDRTEWLRQIETQEEHIFILKKKEKILQDGVNTLKETVEVLRRKSDVTLGVSSESSHQLELLIEKEAQWEQEYDEIQKELKNHDKLLSGHQVNMTDSPTTRGLSSLSTDMFENDEVTLRKHNDVQTYSTEIQESSEVKEETTKNKDCSSDSAQSAPNKPVIMELLVSVDIKQTGDDQKEPFLSGLDFLPDGRLVAVDNWNWKCIILDDRLQILGTPYTFNAYPYDVVCLAQCEVAVAMYRTVCLLSVSSDNVISLTRQINTSTEVDSICCMTPTTMVVNTYDDPRPVRMIHQTGVESDFDRVLFNNKTYTFEESKCTYVPSKNTLVLTDRYAHTVYMFDTVKGTSRAVTNENIQRPIGACVGPGDTVLVCSGAKNSIVHITVDGDILCTYHVDMQLPYTLCMKNDGSRLVVSGCKEGMKKMMMYKLS
ncbi:uncharacterized protein LOC127833252 [Dreissena polymorpha]|uniref:uncharacterized protein LOC127833252 n=1 Tax=Dreissena polymorpha TaxID=45954 RepID=UPI0022656165|nr:uncharacterized protein LOC127833252 [Dreissena polymorpha]